VTHLIWRLHRNQVAFAAVALTVLAVVLLVTGTRMIHDYDVFVSTCSGSLGCDTGELFRGDGAVMDLVDATLAVPLLFGLFWGAPLFAKEIEDGTHNLVWTQGVSRRRFVMTNIGWSLAAAVAWGTAVACLVSWWRTPENAIFGRFASFDIQGIVPIAYSLFAVALGLAVGSLVRRVMPAVAATLGAFAAVRLAVAFFLRPHYMRPITAILALSSSSDGAPAGSWVLSTGVVAPGGVEYDGGFPISALPAACRSAGKGDVLSCAMSHGFHQVVAYQPASRFWAFQGIEAAGFVVLAAALLAVTYLALVRRDA
jgi:hypothetical protein